MGSTQERGNKPLQCSFLDMHRYFCFSPTVLWESTHQLNQLLGGGSRFWLWQRRAQFRHHLVTHCDLNLGAGILSHVANQLWQSFPGFADGQFHGLQCTSAYKGSQSALLIAEAMGLLG